MRIHPTPTKLPYLQALRESTPSIMRVASILVATLFSLTSTHPVDPNPTISDVNTAGSGITPQVSTTGNIPTSSISYTHSPINTSPNSTQWHGKTIISDTTPLANATWSRMSKIRNLRFWPRDRCDSYFYRAYIDAIVFKGSKCGPCYGKHTSSA